MKRFLFIIVISFIFPFALLANGYDLTFNHSDARTTLHLINKATGYDFVYKQAVLEDCKGKVNGVFRGMSINELLDNTILYQLGLSYKIVDKSISLKKATPEELTRTVIGVVTDESNEPLPGATILVKNTTYGVSTDLEGRFEIKVNSQNPVLRVSYVGMESEDYPITYLHTSKPIHISLHTLPALMDEVVVTGYQELKKEKMTGAVTTINSEKLGERFQTNVLDNLEGQVAGLSTYGGKPVIRGVGTLHGETSPLLVVDGLPVEGKIEDLNPYDIESVNVLKDAAAAAIYGARAANGIIVITTKNARKQGKFDIDFATNITVYDKVNYDYSDNFYMTPEQQVNAESKYYDYYFFGGEIADPIQATQTVMNQLTREITPIHMAYYRHATGDINRQTLEGLLDSYRRNNFAKEYADVMTHRQVVQQYNLSLRSSTERTRHNVVMNYKHDSMNLLNHGKTWLNIFYKGSYDLAKWLTATMSVNGIYANNKTYGYDYNSNMFNPWYYPAYMPFNNEDGSVRTQYPIYSGASYWTPNDGCADLGINPMEEVFQNTLTTRQQNTRYHLQLLFKPVKGLKIDTQFIYEIDNTQQQNLATEESHAARTIKNAFAYLENGEVKYMTPKQGGFLKTTNINSNSWTARLQGNYNFTFFEKNELEAIAGLEFRQTLQKGTKSLALGYDEQLQNSATQTVDFGTLSLWNTSPYFMRSAAMGFPCSTYAFLPYLNDGIGIVPEQKHRYASGYFNVTYTYDYRYNLFGSFRKDYADVYGLDTKYRGKPLWSLGAGWNIHNESFLRDVSWISFLKLRASYGVTGNIYQGATSLMTANSQAINNFTRDPMAVVLSPANPDLRWEQNKTTNIGVEFNLLDFRLRGSVDWYNRQGTDIFHNMNLDPSFGFTSMVANIASIRNRGIEAALSYDWFRPGGTKSFSWTSSLTYTQNSNIVTDVETDATTAGQLIRTPYKKGYPVSAMWSYRFAKIGDEKGRQGFLLFYGDNDAIVSSPANHSSEILEFSGQSDPKYNIGMTNSFRWNGLSLVVVMVYYGGHKMRALAEGVSGSSFQGALDSYFNEAWTPENPTNHPGIGQYGGGFGSHAQYSNMAVHKADFLKIRNIVLGYDLPLSVIRHIGLDNCRLTFQINNLKAVWTANKIGVDPETLRLRNPSSYVFGINFNI